MKVILEFDDAEIRELLTHLKNSPLAEKIRGKLKMKRGMMHSTDDYEFNFGGAI
jgi:hypothetical protein